MALPLAEYVRVSSIGTRDESRMRSPDFQRAAIRHGASAYGVTTAYYADEMDVSGSIDRRPVLDAIIADVKDGKLGGIIVAKLDRLSRMKPRDRVELFHDVESAGGVILSASENLDVSTSEGRFARDVFLGVARMQWENYASGFQNAKRAAMDSGIKIGPTPFGYTRNAGRLEPHPVYGPAVTEAFRLAAERGLHAAVDYLSGLGVVHEEGKRAGRARAFTTATVRRLLANRAYLGVNSYGGRTESDAHPPLVTRRTWEAAQPPKTRRRHGPRSYPLSGLARCAECGSVMTGATAGSQAKTVRTYRCAASLVTYKGAAECSPMNTITAERLEEYVRATLSDVLSDTQRQDGTGEDELRAAELALREAEDELNAFVSDAKGAALLRRVGSYDAGLAARVAAVEDAQAAYRTASAGIARGLTSVSPDVLAAADLPALGEIARGGLAAITVRRGRLPLDERIRLIPHGVPLPAPLSSQDAA